MSELILPNRTIITDVAATPSSRRSFLKGLAATLVVAPAIIKDATSLMPINPLLRDLGPIGDMVECDGRVFAGALGEYRGVTIRKAEPWLYELIEGERDRERAQRPEWYRPQVLRRYGGSVEEGTFAVPDFSEFKQHFGGPNAKIELDRNGDLWVTHGITGEREKV